jgi:hypothetical protein
MSTRFTCCPCGCTCSAICMHEFPLRRISIAIWWREKNSINWWRTHSRMIGTQKGSIDINGKQIGGGWLCNKSNWTSNFGKPLSVGIYGSHDGGHAWISSSHCSVLAHNHPHVIKCSSQSMHQSPQSSIRFVAPLRALHDCCKPKLGQLYGAYTHYGNNHKGSTI